MFIWMHTAITTPHITKITQQFTGTYYGVYMYAYSSKNTTYNLRQQQHHRNIKQWCLSVCIQQQQHQYNQNYTTIHRNIWCLSVCIQLITMPHITKTTTTSQEHQAMVFICMQTAITTQKTEISQYHRNIRWCLSVCIQQQKYHI